MQAYEHIMATMLKFAKDKNNGEGYDLDKTLHVMRKYGAYVTYPDSVRASVAKTLGTAYRSVSHFTDGAGMKYIIGDQLKQAESYPISKMQIPFGIESKAAEGSTDIIAAKKANEDVFETFEGSLIFNHLYQDTLSDRFYQTDIAECYYKPNGVEEKQGETVSLYGVQAKEGLCRFKNSGEITSMSEFRKVVSSLQVLTTFELYKRLKNTYPNVTLDKINEVITASYEDTYPESMQNARKYIVPSKELQDKMDYALRTKDTSYFDGVRHDLVERKIYNSDQELSHKISRFIDDATKSRTQEKEQDYIPE